MEFGFENCVGTLLLLIKENLLFFKGSVYFTAKMLVATDWLELLCRQPNIQSRGMTQFE